MLDNQFITECLAIIFGETFCNLLNIKHFHKTPYCVRLRSTGPETNKLAGRENYICRQLRNGISKNKIANRCKVDKHTLYRFLQEKKPEITALERQITENSLIKIGILWGLSSFKAANSKHKLYERKRTLFFTRN